MRVVVDEVPQNQVREAVSERLFHQKLVTRQNVFAGIVCVGQGKINGGSDSVILSTSSYFGYAEGFGVSELVLSKTNRGFLHSSYGNLHQAAGFFDPRAGSIECVHVLVLFKPLTCDIVVVKFEVYLVDCTSVV